MASGGVYHIQKYVQLLKNTTRGSLRFSISVGELVRALVLYHSNIYTIKTRKKLKKKQQKTCYKCWSSTSVSAKIQVLHTKVKLYISDYYCLTRVFQFRPLTWILIMLSLKFKLAIKFQLPAYVL